MINWDEEYFNKLSQEDKDLYIDSILQKKDNRDKECQILTKRQMNTRYKHEVHLQNCSLSKQEKNSCKAQFIEIEY